MSRPQDFKRPRGLLDFDEAVGLSEVEFGDGGDEVPTVDLLSDEIAGVLDGGGGVAPDTTPPLPTPTTHPPMML